MKTILLIRYVNDELPLTALTFDNYLACVAWLGSRQHRFKIGDLATISNYEFRQYYRFAENVTPNGLAQWEQCNEEIDHP